MKKDAEVSVHDRLGDRVVTISRQRGGNEGRQVRRRLSPPRNEDGRPTHNRHTSIHDRMGPHPRVPPRRERMPDSRHNRSRTEYMDSRAGSRSVQVETQSRRSHGEPARKNEEHRRAHDRHDILILSPFSPEIDAVRPPLGFSPPKFNKYDPKTDAYTHLVHFFQMMFFYSWEDGLMCKLFPSRLGEAGLLWFDRMPRGSISSWRYLSTAFQARFITNTKVQKEVDSLLGLRRARSESLRQYATRYWDLYNEIE